MRSVMVLTADTGGGHRAAADAIVEAVGPCRAGDVVARVCDPLTGPAAPRRLRRVCRWYGPLTQYSPELWTVLFYLTNTPPVLWLVRRMVARWTWRLIAAEVGRHRAAVLVVVHPLLVDAAVAARARSGLRPGIVTVVTDLATAHRAWWHPGVDRTIAPSAELVAAGAGRTNGLYPLGLGVPVRRQCTHGGEPDRAGNRRERFVVLVTAGGEGMRGLSTWVRALVTALPDIDVVAICGRNESLRRVLEPLAAACAGRLHVEGYVTDIADRLRAADLVVTKAGPGIIAEATALGVPLLLSTEQRGQETGNTDLLVKHGAARRVRGRRDLVRQVDVLRHDPTALAELRAAARDFGRPHAAFAIADVIAGDAHERVAAA